MSIMSLEKQNKEVVKMIYDYSKLIGRIAELGMTRNGFADAIGISRTSLYQKLRSVSEFTQREIQSAVTVLKLCYEDIPAYFFTLKVQKAKH